jgi:hypothetical protein
MHQECASQQQQQQQQQQGGPHLWEGPLCQPGSCCQLAHVLQQLVARQQAMLVRAAEWQRAQQHHPHVPGSIHLCLLPQLLHSCREVVLRSLRGLLLLRLSLVAFRPGSSGQVKLL